MSVWGREKKRESTKGSRPEIEWKWGRRRVRTYGGERNERAGVGGGRTTRYTKAITCNNCPAVNASFI